MIPQQVYHRLRLTLSSCQSSAHQISGYSELEQQLWQHQHRHDEVPLSQPLGQYLKGEQWLEAVVEVAKEEPPEA
uniref:Uncharacterized protein n=1 Tax=Solanum tuberosum TaxID=4113 RepID=M1DTK9_SOLTU